MDRLALPQGVQAWVKREDLSHAVYGGNKVRKLEWLLPDIAARGGTMVTLGAGGSHHAIASALFGAQAGVKVHAVLVPQPDSPHVRENLRLSLSLAHRVWPCGGNLDVPRQIIRAFLAARREDGTWPVWVGPGGSSPIGCLGWVQGGLEIAQQIAQQAMPEPTAVLVPAGSTGTAAGLMVGLALSGLSEVTLHAVRVTEKWMANHRTVFRLAQRTRALLVAGGAQVPPLRPSRLIVHHGYCGPGYGHDTEAGRAARDVAQQRAGLVLEATYTAKTFAALLALSEQGALGKRVLFVDTVSSAPLDALLAQAPAQVPADCLRLLQGAS
jgi:D-cysteine desulfhydrase